DIIVVEAGNYKFYVSGEVKNPSGYPHREGLTVHQAIAWAGGLTEKAERGTFQRLRRDNGHEKTIAVGLDSLVLPDDIIVVDAGQRVYVSGEVKTPGRYLYEKGLTVHKAISMAGGWTEKAERGPVKVTRVVEGIAETLVATPEMAVLPDDIIVVEAGNYKFYVSGEVKTAGGYRYEEGLTVHKAISVAGGRTEKAERGPVKVTRLAGGIAETKVATPEMAVLPDDIIVVEADNYKFYVSGEVKNPSGYPHREGLTVHQAIAMAGGVTEKAEGGIFQTLRRDNGQEKTIAVGLDSLVLPDDIIVVAEGQRVYVSGEVKTPGRYLYEKGLTVHKAISMAGGWTEKAERGPVKVTRVVEGVAETKVATPEMAVLPDDIIVVEAGNYKFY